MTQTLRSDRHPCRPCHTSRRSGLLAGYPPRVAEPRTTRFAALDGLRIVGALMVVTTHVGFTSGLAIHVADPNLWEGFVRVALFLAGTRGSGG